MRNFKRVLMLPAVLALSLMTQGCMIHLTGPEVAAAKADRAIVTQVCSIWEGLSYDSKKDTVITVDGIKVNNKRRAAFCKLDK